MKKSTFVIGLVSAFLILIGVGFKFQHWPGAGIMVTLGAVLFALVYSVLLWIDKNKIAQNSYQKFVNLMTMLTMLIIMAGFLFKIQHWPGAGVGIFAGHILLILMIPILLVQASRETDPVRKLNFNHNAVLLIVLTAFALFIWLIIGKH